MVVLARSKFSFHESVCKLLQNIDEDDFVDLIVECAHNKIVKAHRVILAMHSRILHQLLLLPDIEERLELPAVNQEDFLLVKCLMYKGFVWVDADQRQEFLDLLEEFEIDCTETYDRPPSEPPTDQSKSVEPTVEVAATTDDDDDGEDNANDVVEKNDAANDTVDDDDVEDDDVHDKENGNVGVDVDDLTIPTSANEIVENLFRISEDDTDFSQHKYSLRYWLAVILVRWSSKLSEPDIESKFGIPRSTIKTHMLKEPATHNYIAATRRKYVATTAEQIVEHMCNPEGVIVQSDETYSLRFWMSIALRRMQRIDRKQKSVAALCGIGQAKLSRGKRNGRTPAMDNFFAAVDPTNT